MSEQGKKKGKRKRRLSTRVFKRLKKFLFRNRVTGRLISFALGIFLRMIFKTYRITIEGGLPPGPKIAAFWHQRLFAMIHHFRGTKGGIVISSSVDGDLMALIAERFGYAAIRMPRRRQANGMRLTKEVMTLLRNGNTLAVTPDGPNGPPGEVPPGLMKLAAICKAPIVPMGYSATFKWVFPSWDRFILPLPCSRIHVVHGPPIISSNGTPEQIKAKRREVQQGIHEATAAADRHLGQKTIPPTRPRRRARAQEKKGECSPQ